MRMRPEVPIVGGPAKVSVRWVSGLTLVAPFLGKSATPSVIGPEEAPGTRSTEQAASSSRPARAANLNLGKRVPPLPTGDPVSSQVYGLNHGSGQLDGGAACG